MVKSVKMDQFNTALIGYIWSAAVALFVQGIYRGLKMFKKPFLLLSLFLSANVWSDLVPASGTVTDIYYYGNGMLLVQGFNFGSTHCTGSNNGFVIDGSYPQLDKILSIILMAKATQRELLVYADVPPSNCWAPTFGVNNYLILK